MNLEFELLINWKHRNSIFYKKIGTDTLITCKPKMVSIVSINCKFGATECSARVYESLRCLQIWGHSGSKGPKKKKH